MFLANAPRWHPTLQWLHFFAKSRRKTFALARLFVLGEIAQGVNSNPTPDLQLFLQEILSFPIAEFGEAEALEWGRLTSEGFKKGLSMQARDSMIAATASVRGWMVATANVADFKPLGVQVFNPWKDKL